MSISDLERLQQSGQFHHATYRDFGTVWEGLHVYAKDATGFRGFRHIGAFGKRDPNLETAMQICKGVSVGAYGQG